MTHHSQKVWTPATHHVYSDGACAPTNPGPCGWGVVIIELSIKKATDHFGFIGHGTNQIAELSAAIYGLELVSKNADAMTSIELYSDSQYVLKGMREWRVGWERNGWRNSKKEPVANKSLWQHLFALDDLLQVRTNWVKGHSGDEFNERADALAVKSLKQASLDHA